MRGLGECGIRRVQQLAIIRYARGPYQPTSVAPTYDVGIPQGVVSKLNIISYVFIILFSLVQFITLKLQTISTYNSKHRVHSAYMFGKSIRIL